MLKTTIKFSSAPSNLWKHKVFLGPKRLYLGLWAGTLKNCCHIWNQRSPTYLIVKFCPKIRILKFGTKNALSGCFGQQFWKTTVIFEISGPLLALLQRLDCTIAQCYRISLSSVSRIITETCDAIWTSLKTMHYLDCP